MSGNNKDKTDQVTLKVAETYSKFVGRGMALVDPKIMEEMNLSPGDVIEITGKKKIYVLLWSGQSDDYGRQLIRIDGYTRNDIGTGIGSNVMIRKMTVSRAEQVILAPIEELNIVGLEEYLAEILEGRVVTKGNAITINVMGREIGFVVAGTTPADAPLLVDGNTEFILGNVPKSASKTGPRISYEDIGGLRNEVQKVREMIELPLRHPEIFERIGIEAPKGVLLYGPPGTGKTLLAKAVASETNATFYSISGPEIMSKFHGESEERLRQVFQEAEQNAPSIIFIDEIDSIAPKREEVSGDVEKRVVSQLLTLMDGIKSRGKLVVIGATNRPDALDPALRRPGRFDREIEIGIPDDKGRLEVLQIHTRGMPLTEDVKLDSIAKVTHGFVGADLEALSKEAAMRSLRRILPEIDMEQTKIPAEILNKIKITDKDFQEALKDVQPSAMREVVVQRPNVKWEDIGGLIEIKDELAEAIDWPLKHADLFEEADVHSPTGILLYGPPGTGKTLLAKAVATTTEANFISVKGPELMSKWVGESEKGVREIFRKARQAAPCVVFFDEIDAIAPRRGGSDGDTNVTERVVSQMLTEMDGLEGLKGVVVIGATNRPDIIDEALLRPGRFDRILEVPMPDKESRIQILKIHTQKKPLDSSVNLEQLVSITDGYSGAEIASLVNAAAIATVKERVKSDSSKKIKDKQKPRLQISMKHFEEAQQKIKGKYSDSLKSMSSTKL
ncbi:CDC48 family AAA ATPase [Candidatus Nitrososphaera sp. FF02]|uniref:CDC48 family AAA ATPase n=1 Tax=Candidatus Nitrososphaera sp. FF02 TaxID=3398226 RepID=UPI0039ED38BB